MKEILEMFIYKPKKTERIVIVLLKLLFSMCFTIWFYEYIGIKDIIEQLTEFDKLKLFILKGNLILFLFVYFVIYQVFFNLSSSIFSLIGFASYWIARLTYFICFSVILDFLFSLIAWPITKKFRFKLKYKSNIDDGFFAFSYRIMKRTFVRTKLMKSKEQRIRTSKKLNNFAKEIKFIMIENSEIVYKHIHTLFTFITLFYVYYFYYLKSSMVLHPILDRFVFWICIILGSFQIVAYWIYSNFRLIYYFYLLLYRGFHKQDVIEREMELFMIQLTQDLQLNPSEETNDDWSNTENQD